MASAIDDDELSQNNAVTGFFTNVDHFTIGTGFEEYDINVVKEITKLHWKPVTSSSRCFNPTCRKVFNSVFERHHHCRKCGELFCQNCVQCKRRLNKLAHFDPDGQPYKVCQGCFEKDVITEGESRSHTSDFLKLRSFLKARAATSGGLGASSIWKTATNFNKECQRLLDGFADSVDKSDLLQTFHQMKSIVSKPDWMRSSVWVLENTLTRCRVCQENFGLITKKNFCRVCGIAVCKACSSNDLLLYIPDGEKNSSRNVKLAIIKIIGCPEVEPEISAHLRVCPMCRDKLVARQVEAVEDEDHSVGSAYDFMGTLSQLYEKFHQAEEGVRLQLPNYMSVVESLEDGSRKTPEKSNMRILAKAQEDLADALARHVTLVQQLKKLNPNPGTQTSLLKTFIKAKCEFYLNNMSSFRSVRHKLNNSVPADCLDFIQRMMDKNAIISTHLALRQLVYELLHLSQRHGIEDALPTLLVTVEQEIEAEVKRSLTQSGENIEEHMEVVKEMTRVAIKDHKWIRISQTALRSKEKGRVHRLVLVRSEDILNQIMNQLHLASANRSFPGGKQSLEDALTEVKGWKVRVRKDHEEKDGFILVDSQLL